ncbi:hypothetical protein AGMMS49983_14770 [Clostridia bacterium]|nr:hypothetical protein AGMMS49983_14770 [Clostridia bacterium]
MKTAVSMYTFDQGVDYGEAIDQIAKAGYDGVEFVVSEGGQLNMKSSDKDILALKNRANDAGLKMCSVGAWNLWEYNLVAEDLKEYQHAMDIVKKQIDVAEACGGDTVLVVPGWVGTPFAPGIVPYELAYERAQERLRILGQYAAAAKVFIGVENVWNKFLLSPVEVKMFLDEINAEYVGFYFDVGNIIYIGYPDQWMRILRDRIKKLHFCDCRADQNGLGMFVDLLEGDVDFEAVMHTAREIGYDDWAVVEFLPNYKKFPYQSVINAKLSLDTILNIT